MGEIMDAMFGKPKKIYKNKNYKKQGERIYPETFGGRIILGNLKPVSFTRKRGDTQYKSGDIVFKNGKMAKTKRTNTTTFTHLITAPKGKDNRPCGIADDDWVLGNTIFKKRKKR